ncbi:MAG: peptide-methionine (S)-S-oxide reductase MsrA [Rubricoccaceae bacterium]|nr:peptide-methionine (S)-S-oxide reductase MsrA [Rubricoccaceae bacterium]
MNETLATATFGGGCFWCVEAVMQPLRGVTQVTSGYAGGRVKNPSYREVCAGRTGHAEVVQVTYDPDEISYRDLLFVFFATHNPTTRNRQGADVGSQYRSIVLYETEDERATAEAVIAELEAEGVFDQPIVTEVAPLEAFYPAEAHHQDYYRRNPQAPYCQAVIAPKVAKLRARFLDRLRAEDA